MASKIETTLRATLAALDAGDPDKAARLLRAALAPRDPAVWQQEAMQAARNPSPETQGQF